MRQKTIWMIALLIGILSNQLLISCKEKEIEEGVQFEKFIYINNSSHLITIEKFNSTTKTDYIIEKQDSLIQEIELFFGDTQDVIFFSDSINVLFDNEKVSFFLPSENKEGNILTGDVYTTFQEGSKKVNKYIFTDLDYENAEIINTTN